MSGRQRMLHAVNVLILASLILAGCTPVDARWQEEVALDTGQVIVVRRQVRYDKAGGEWGRDSGWRPSGERLTFLHPISGTEVVWSDPHRIASYLGMVDGIVWVVARQQTCGSEHRGQPFWQAFALRVNGWAPSGPEEAPAITAPNLALDSANYEKTSHWRFVTISQKGALDDASRVDARMRRIQWRSDLDC